jgi:hypothetical protein
MFSKNWWCSKKRSIYYCAFLLKNNNSNWTQYKLVHTQPSGFLMDITRWLSGVEITEIMSENVPLTGSGTGDRNQFSVPSTGSGTGSSNKYNTVIERSRNHREWE